jgi:hypothetical protein
MLVPEVALICRDLRVHANLHELRGLPCHAPHLLSATSTLATHVSSRTVNEGNNAGIVPVACDGILKPENIQNIVDTWI